MKTSVSSFLVGVSKGCRFIKNQTIGTRKEAKVPLCGSAFWFRILECAYAECPDFGFRFKQDSYNGTKAANPAQGGIPERREMPFIKKHQTANPVELFNARDESRSLLPACPKDSFAEAGWATPFAQAA